MRKIFLNILGGLHATKTTLAIPEIRKSIPAASTWKFAAMFVCSLWLLGGARLSAKGASGHPESAWKVLAVGRIYVDLTAVGANNGTTWTNAYTDLQNALAAAVSGDTIMVAAGTYKPDLAGPGNRTLSFGMKTGVVVLGGFPTGGGTLAQRNWVSNPTILSGDIGTQGVHTDNSYHVVRCNGQQGELNGFVVERGRADGAAPDNDGGGVFVTSGYVASRFCTFRNNFAADQGGGSYHDAGGNPTFRQCKFESNSAAFGGGSYAFASTIIANCGYVGNSATSNGGGVYAVVNINMYNVTFKGNSATTSGNAIYYQSGGSNRLFNSIVWGNIGSGTHIAGAGSITLRSCIIEGGCPGGGATCTSIQNVNPQFSDVAGHLASNSPAIDAGENTTGDGNSDALTIDLDNLNRNFDAIPGGVSRDMGAYESQALNLSRYYVDHTATGANDGTSWANAFTAFQSAVAAASSGDTVFVAAGTHKPSTGPGYSRTWKFTLAEGVRYYGGFPNGGGTFAQRDFSANRTILSGDIGNAIDSTDNCFVVVDALNLTPATLMSGFTVEEGNADSTGFPHPFARAGGIHLGATGSIRMDSLTIRNNFGKGGSGIYAEGPTNWVVRGCIFDNNTNAGAIYVGGNATGSFSNCTFNNNQGFVGGAISLNVLTATFSFTNCNFTNNVATASGGGGAVNGGNAGCTWTNCTFTNNRALTGSGGALYKFYSTLNTFTNCTFTGNRAAGGGGALQGNGGFNLFQCVFRQNLVTGNAQHGGALYMNGGSGIIENCLFWDNRTTQGIGGAVYNNTGGTFTVRNSTFANNNAVGYTQGGGFNNNSSSNASFNNCIFWGNLANNNDVPANSEIGHGSGSLTVTNTIWQGQTPSGTIYNVNPLFTNQATGDLTLTLCSPAIDTGSTAGMPVIDVTGVVRPFNARPGTFDYDLGAYEFQSSAVDVTPPNAICQNVTVNLNAGGTGSTTAAAVNNGSTDNCAITSMSVNTTAFTCANVGANTVTLTLSDAAGNTSSCNATVTVQDVTPPTALCQNVTVSLDGAGTASLTGAMLNNGSSDICGIASLNPSMTSFTCNNLNTSKLFISDADRVFKTDLLGNNRTNLNPLAAALYTLAVVPSKDSVYIANFNQGKLQRVHLNGGTVTDIKTGVQPFGIAVDHLAGKIYWADPNANTISRCNMDGSGTQVIISGAGEADYSRMIKLDLTNGKIYWTDANLGTVKRANLDGTGLQTIVTGQGNIVGLDLDVAANKLYFSSYSFSQIKRTNLDGTGLTVIVAAAGSVPLGLALDIPAGKIYWVNGTGGNTLKRCDLNGSNQVTLQSGMNLPYDIGLIPAMPVVLTVTDVNANAATCTGFVNVQDLIVPTISCPSNISANNSLGVCSANVTYATPVGTDNCASTTTQTMGLASGAAFPVGVTTNTFSVADGSGNSATCSFTVTVTDNVAPVIICPSNISTSNGVGTLLASYPLQTNLTDATGNFGAATISGNPTPPAAPTPGNGVCHNGIPVQFPNGQNTLTPNIGTLNPANFTLKVDFKLTGYPGTSTGAPVILGGNSWRWLGIWVSQTGQAGVTYNNSNRVYSSAILSLNTWYAGEIRFSANTAHLFINHVEVLTVATGALVSNSNLNFTTNHSGNGTALNGCIQNLQIMNGTTPNCGVTVYYPTPVGTDNCASTTNRTSGLASGSTFPIGTTTNVFQVTDASGATATCSSTVTVVDMDLPVLTCPSNIAAGTDPGLCTKAVTYTAPVGTDNCPGTTTSQTLGLASNAAFPVGTTTNVFQATDAVGNTSTCSFTVTISDNEAPTAVCQNITVQLDNAGNASITAAAVDNGSADACGIASITVNPNAFVCANVGANSVVLSVTDVNGNTSTCGATVTVEDHVNPVASCQNITVNLDATGNASITGAAVNNGSSDACGIASLTPSPSTFNCTNVSAPPTELFISEYIEGSANNRCLEIYNGTGAPVNLSGYQILIFANGGTVPGPPIALAGTVAHGDVHVICHPTAAAPFLAQADQTSALINYNGDDAVVLANGFTPLDVVGVVGEDPGIQWLQAGKSTLDQTIVRNPNVGAGNTALTPGFPSLGTEWTSLGLNNSSNIGMHNSSVGSSNLILTVTDVNGNTSTCSSSVTVVDAVAPVALCRNITVQLDGSGNAPLSGAMIDNGSSDACGISSLIPNTVFFTCSNLGANAVILTVTDVNGNTATCNSTVTIADTIRPVIVCPNGISMGNDLGSCNAVVTFATPVGTDNCTPITTQSSGLASGAAFPVGTTTNTYLVTDAAGNTATCSFTVVISDNELPTITCPANVSGNNDPGLCSKVVAFAAPVGADNCPSPVTIQTTGLASNAAFPVGVTTNTFRVTDASGNTATCSFTVVISDNELPTITCPTNVTGNNDPGQCSKVVAFAAPVGTDNCPSATTMQTAGLASGSAFPVGTTTNAFLVTDASGNTATCSFTVAISDNQLPSITCPGNVTGTNDPGLCSKVVTFTLPVGTDNCAGATTTQTAGLTSGSAFPVGTTTNAYLVTDAAGNTTTCSFTLVITDNQLPTITCPANVTGNNDPGLCSKVVTFTAPVGSDNCLGATTTQTAGLPSGSAFPIGTTMNAYLVTDASGNTATCSFTVVISDNELPTITCPANITGNNDPGLCSKVVLFTAPVGSDNCPGAVTTQTAGLSSGVAFPIGTTTNVFRVTDATGNTSTCSFTVVITDNQLPTINCPSNINGNNDPGLCSKVVTFVVPVGMDNCPSAVSTQTAGLPSGSAFPVGITTNAYLVTDASGNTATCSFTVVITDNQLPTITCPSNITGNNDPGLCSKIVSFTAPVGADNCASATTQTAGLVSGAAFPIGTTSNAFLVTDASGNTAACSFTVVITDNQLPTIICPVNIVGNNDPGLCSKVVTFAAPVGADNCPSATTTQTAGLPSGSTFPIGTTTNTYLVTDASGNTATCSFTVVITDNELPTISCPSNITGNNDPGLCSKVVTFTVPVGSDNCPSATTTQTAGLTSGSAFPIGTTTNAYLVTDASGNTATCSFTVVITDNQLPTISCPSNIIGNNDAGLCSKLVTYAAPLSTDNCSGATITQTAGLASGSAFPVGTTSNAFLVTDASGNTATCSFTIAISDTELPTITCPSNITGNNDPGLCAKVVTFIAPVGTDNCPSANTTQTAGLASNVAFPVGTTTNTFTVTDASGNTATCSFTVVITDNQLPTITCPSNVTGNNDPGPCSKLVTFTAPVGVDNCAGATTTQTAGLASGSAFPVGSTTNAFLVSDASGNSATCSFTVMITDNQLPTIVCPSNIAGNNDVGLCSKVVNFLAIVGTDNCPGATTMQTAGLPSGSAFPVGSTTNAYLVTDASGNTATCSFTVVISDNELPIISCPSNIIGNNDPGLCSKVVSFSAPVGTDNCAGATTTQTAGLASGSVFPIGATTNAYLVTDGSGNSATCSFTVVISDNELPSITCPSNIAGTNDLGLCAMVATFTTPVGTDNCPSATTIQPTGLVSGSAFPVGTTTNTFRVTDAAGNTATCSFTVMVTDSELPTITCPSNVNSSNDPGLCSSVVNYTTPVGLDNCAGPLTTFTSGLAPGATFPIGITTNSFLVVDAAANSATCAFTVTINDTELPIITCPASLSVSASLGVCAAPVSFTTPVGTDNCSGQLTVQNAGLVSGAMYPVGTTTNAYTVTDASGNTATCAFTITVVDTQLPTITCPASLSMSAGVGVCDAVVTFTAPVGSDNCPLATTTQTAGLGSGATFPIGTTTNSYTVTDASGNSATCAFTVTVNDTELPTISCPANIGVASDLGQCSAVVSYATPVGTDNCPAAATLQTGGLLSGSAFPVGSTTNIFVVTDASGNSTSCAFTVVVTDNQLPQWSGCPNNVVLVADSITCSTTHTWTSPTATDECNVTSTTTTHNPGTSFAVGTTTVIYTATDPSGNTATCSFTVTVDPTPIVANLIVSEAGCYNIACHGDSSGSATVQVFGGCLPYMYQWSHGATSAAASGLGAGSYTVTVTDANGTMAVLGVTLTEPAALTAVISGTPVVCAGDSTASLSVATSGGNDCAVYHLLWSTGDTVSSLSGLASGAYSVTLTDSLGCSVTDTWTVQAEAIPVFSLGADTSMCPGIPMVLTGPSGLATYLWSNGDTGSTTTLTQVDTVSLFVQSAIGCAWSDTIIVGEHVVNNNLITPDGPLTICDNVQLTLTAISGQAGYLWNTGSTNPAIVVVNAGGPFWVHAEDANGCIAKDTVFVNYQPFTNPNPQIIPGPAAFLCEGGSLILDAQSGYFAYAWSTGETTQLITVTAPGTFDVTVSNGFGCTKVSPAVVVTEVPNPEPPIFLNAGTLSTANYASYQWMLNGGNIFGAIWPTFVPAAPGWYQVAIVDANGCQGTSDSLFVSLVGMGDAAEGNSGLSLYPNPSSEIVHLLSDMPIETAVEVEVWDMFGRKVKVFNFNHLRTEAELDLTDIARATYTVKVKTTRRQPELQAIFKLVIQ